MLFTTIVAAAATAAVGGCKSSENRSGAKQYGGDSTAPVPVGELAIALDQATSRAILQVVQSHPKRFGAGSGPSGVGQAFDMGVTCLTMNGGGCSVAEPIEPLTDADIENGVPVRELAIPLDAATSKALLTVFQANTRRFPPGSGPSGVGQVFSANALCLTTNGGACSLSEPPAGSRQDSGDGTGDGIDPVPVGELGVGLDQVAAQALLRVFQSETRRFPPSTGPSGVGQTFSGSVLCLTMNGGGCTVAEAARPLTDDDLANGAPVGELAIPLDRAGATSLLATFRANEARFRPSAGPSGVGQAFSGNVACLTSPASCVLAEIR